LVVGDHGEIIGELSTENVSARSRLSELHDRVVKPLFIVKPPTDLPSELANALAANSDSLIGHIDIAPSLAHLLGVKLSGELCYSGCSLFDRIPQDRILYALNTNEWRSWSRGAVGIFRGRSSAIVDYLDQQLCRYGNGEFPGSIFEREDLLRIGLREPLIQKSLSRIYKDKLNLR
jgi:hypothetical protein